MRLALLNAPPKKLLLVDLQEADMVRLVSPGFGGGLFPVSLRGGPFL